MGKAFFRIFLLLFIGVHSLSAQNALPVVSNTHAVIDTIAHSIKIFYDVEDADNDPLEITFAVSNDSGLTFLVDVAGTEGDAGFPVTPGAVKIITCNYDPATAGFLSGFTNFAVKISADDLQEINIQDIVDKVDAAGLWTDLLMIEGTRNRTNGLQHLLNVRDTLSNRTKSNGLQYRLNEFTFSNFACQNIIGRLPGLTNEKATILITGHYDCATQGPGADDNGTAVAGVLQAIKVLNQYTFNKSIEFVFFDVEEDGLIGSKRYVQHDVPAYSQIEGVLNFEMIGFYSDANNSQLVPAGFSTLFPDAVASIEAQQNKGNFILNVANTNSNSLRFVFDSCAADYVPALRVISLAVSGTGAAVPIFRRSDHAPFWDDGLKALMLTDGAETRNTSYHTANDVSSILNQQFFTNVVKATIATVARLCEPIHAGFETSGEFEFEAATGVDIDHTLPVSFSICQNYPNPFNPSTRINYNIGNESKVKLTVYNYLGEKVCNLFDNIQSPGEHNVTWNTDGFASGIYILRAEIYDSNSGKLSTKSIKMSFIK